MLVNSASECSRLRCTVLFGLDGVSGRESSWKKQGQNIGINIARSICPTIDFVLLWGRSIALRRLDWVVGSYWPSFYSYLCPSFSITIR
jgi:hypothetical protein